jgi:hypothetical protein
MSGERTRRVTSQDSTFLTIGRDGSDQISSLVPLEALLLPLGRRHEARGAMQAPAVPRGLVSLRAPVALRVFASSAAAG